MGIKDKIKNNPEKFRLAFKMHNKFFGGNKITVHGKSVIKAEEAFLKNVRICVSGDGNVIEIGRLTRMNDTTIYITGNNNRLIIDERNGFEASSLWMEDDNNTITIGAHNRFFKNSHLAALEGTTITIGRDGLIAPEVQLRTSDSHSILDLEGKRTNQAADIKVGNHVWLAAGAVLLKGSEIPDDSVVGIRSLVTKKFIESNCVYAGNPAVKVKEGITWNSQRKK
jgi:acetyltransferase-like isoleucine patch superfamily enzyme